MSPKTGSVLGSSRVEQPLGTESVAQSILRRWLCLYRHKRTVHASKAWLGVTFPPRATTAKRSINKVPYLLDEKYDAGRGR